MRSGCEGPIIDENRGFAESNEVMVHLANGMPRITQGDEREKRCESVARAVNIREASFEDHSAICSLESHYGLESKEYEEWAHLWTCNPAYRQGWPIGWVVERQGKILGYVGNIPMLFELAGQPLMTAATRAWVVDANYRKYSVPLLARYFAQPNVDIYLGTTANAQSSPVLGMFRSVPVPAGAWDQSAFWVTNGRGFSSALLAMKEIPLRQPLSYAASAALLVRDLFTGRGFRGNDEIENLCYCDGFDERFDHFWQARRTEKAGVLLAVRTREVLDWHFKYALLKNQLWILTITSGADLVAYSIFCRQDNVKFGLKRMRLVDFQALEGKSELLLPMLSSARRRCQNEGIHMLECIGIGREVDNLISELRPYRRKLPSWMYYYKPASDVLGARLKDPAVWEPSCFDGDSSL